VVGLRDADEAEVVRECAREGERVLERHGGELGLELALDDGRRVLHPRRAHGDGALVWADHARTHAPSDPYGRVTRCRDNLTGRRSSGGCIYIPARGCGSARGCG
jgi:hypothetical protein